MIKFVVKQLALHFDAQAQIDAQELASNAGDLLNRLQPHNQAIDVTWVPAIQRRRLSPFAKMALSSAQHASAQQAHLPIVFSSRHGDLHKTTQLLNAVTEGEELSPTGFGLSVHNAVAGLFSILTGNQQAINSISGGQDSIMSALVDALANLDSQQHKTCLLVHCDQALPALYSQYSDERQINHSCAFVLQRVAPSQQGFSLTKEPVKNSQQGVSDHLPLSLQLAHAIIAKQPISYLDSNASSWCLRYE